MSGIERKVSFGNTTDGVIREEIALVIRHHALAAAIEFKNLFVELMRLWFLIK